MITKKNVNKLQNAVIKENASNWWVRLSCTTLYLLIVVI